VQDKWVGNAKIFPGTGNTKKNQLSLLTITGTISDVPSSKSEDKRQGRILDYEICRKIIVRPLKFQLVRTICSNLDAEQKKRMNDSVNSMPSKLSDDLISCYRAVLENGRWIFVRSARFLCRADSMNEGRTFPLGNDPFIDDRDPQQMVVQYLRISKLRR
jgi:hypothetical protein